MWVMGLDGYIPDRRQPIFQVDQRMRDSGTSVTWIFWCDYY